MAQEGVSQAEALVGELIADLPPKPAASVMATFNRMPKEGVEAMVGAMQADSPLPELLSTFGAESAQGIGDSLVRNLIAGRNPIPVARDMAKAWGIPLNRAMTIARTEMLRSHRMASLASYRANPHIVKGWKWHAQLDDKVCLSCVAQHGTLYNLDEAMPDHVNGRCAMVPISPSWSDLGFTGMPETQYPLAEGDGERWFKGLGDDEQRAMMGPGKYDAWKAGKFEFSQLSKAVVDKRWGRAFVETPLKELVGEGAMPSARILRKEPEDLGRPVSLAEEMLVQQVDEARVAYESAERAGRTREAQAIKGYYDTMLVELDKERGANDALWRIEGLMPNEDNDEAWNRVAGTLERESRDLYKKYSREGVQLNVMEQRGARDSGYMNVGGHSVQVKRGRFSRRQAQRIQGDLWAHAKEDLSRAMGEQLETYGFRPTDIAQATYEQRIKLMNELGHKELARTARGKASKIDAVSEESRGQVIESLGFDKAAQAASIAQDPLNLPSLDAYGKAELADWIRSTRIYGVEDPDWI